MPGFLVAALVGEEELAPDAGVDLDGADIAGESPAAKRRPEPDADLGWLEPGVVNLFCR
jgi:hypothetical protein